MGSNPLRKQNKGFTLVELLCSIAILSVITLAVSTALVVTAKNYDSGTTEARLQQEAQFTVNRLEGLIVDATSDVSFDPASATMTIINPDGKYVVELIDGKLYFSEITLDAHGAEVVETGVLAENVDKFEADISEFPTNHTLRMVLGVSLRGRHFEGAYQITSRNGAKLTAKEETALIVAPSELTLEPNQEYEFGYSILGISDQSIKINDYGDISDDTKLINANDAGTVVSVTGDKIKIKIGQNETGNNTGACILIINTNKVSEETGTPMDKKVIPVKIRRVSDVEVKSELPVTSLAAGTSIHLKTLVHGSHLEKVPGTDYDVNYVNPYQVTWTAAFFESDADGTGWLNADHKLSTYFTFHENADGTYDITFNQSMPYGSKLVVKATAKHPAGTNKSGIPYGTVFDEMEFTRDTFMRNTCFTRGKDFIWQLEDGFSPQQLKDQYGGGYGDFRWLYRYRAKKADGTYEPWSHYLQAEEAGLTMKINASETYLFLPDKSYQIQIIATVVDRTNRKLLWPYDSSILSGIDDDAGAWSKGWTDDKPVTPGNEYGNVYTLDKVKLYFHANTTFGIEEGSNKVGTEASPIHLVTGDYFEVNMYSDELDCDTFQGNFTAPHIQIWDTGDSQWKNSSVSGFGLQTNRGFLIQNIDGNNHDDYRVGMVMKDAVFKKEKASSKTFSVGMDNLPPVTYDFGNIYTGESIGYFKFN